MCRPFEARPRTTSPGLILLPSMIFVRSTTPTMQPARSYSPLRYIPGICAVSPPSNAQPAARQAREKPRSNCRNTRGSSLLAADIIEKEKRTRAKNRNVIDAVVHQIRAHRVVLVHWRRRSSISCRRHQCWRPDTGSRIPGKLARNNPPNPPIFPST